ncbi:MAG: FG-GAP repeat domain-containing protein [Pirellula sp.]
MRVLTQRFRAIVLGLCSVGIGTLTNSRQLEAQEIEWTVTKLSKLFHGEGGTLADFDGDGSMDIAAGYQIFFGPDFKESTKLFASNPYNINGYSEYFFGFDADIDSDGDPDVLIVGFPGAASHWYRNPGKADARKANWERFTVMEVVDNESPMFKDIDGDGKPDLICSTAGQYGYATVGPDPTKPWVFHPVSETGPYERFTHGIGVGDVNDDKYQDLLAKNGWWENPGAVSNANKLWVFHPFEFSGPGGAQMHAVDLDEDGKTEVVTSLAAHAYGLAVYKKSPGGKEYNWTRIDVMTDKPETSPTGLAISQLHAVEIADIDGDDKPDILTGKRFWAHNGNDPGENDLPLLVWFKPQTVAGGLKFEPHIIHDDSGVGTQVTVKDANRDGKLDVLSVSKRGIHLLTQTPSSKIVHSNHPRDSQGAVATKSIAIKDDLGGFRPAWSESEAMNMEFENGSTIDWEARGGAFFNQPIHNPVGNGNKSNIHQQGEYWIGSSEVGTDNAMGAMTSRAFVMQHGWLSFLIGGGESKETRVELMDALSGRVLHTEHGKNDDNLKRVVVDAAAWKGRAIRIRLVDENRGSWGHISFDDFRTHETAPR